MGFLYIRMQFLNLLLCLQFMHLNVHTSEQNLFVKEDMKKCVF